MENSEVIREVETMKLIKNTKGNNWEIKTIQGKTADGDEEWVKRMVNLNARMEQEFGSTLSLEK